MKFVNYLPDQSYLSHKSEQCRHEYEKLHREQSHQNFMVELAHKLVSEAPQNYLCFGPYWWIVKSVLIKHGYAYCGQLEPVIAATYCGRDANGCVDTDASLIAAFEFADRYNETELRRVREFDLEGTESHYVLMDHFMEFGIG